LGILVRKVSGQFWGDFLQKRVFEPLGMKNARVITEADVIPNRAAGYVLKDQVLNNQKWVSPSVNTTADGSLYFTVEDLAKWDDALEAQKLVKRLSYEQMWTPVRLNDGTTVPYGFGWRISKTDSGRRILEHGGAWQGFASYIVRYPRRSTHRRCTLQSCGCRRWIHCKTDRWILRSGSGSCAATTRRSRT